MQSKWRLISSVWLAAEFIISMVFICEHLRKSAASLFRLLSSSTLANSHLQNFSDVQGFASREAFNLLVTAESISDDKRVSGGSAHGGQQDALADFD